MGVGLFLEVKRPGNGVDHPLPSSAEAEGRVEFYLYSPYVSAWQDIGQILPFIP